MEKGILDRNNRMCKAKFVLTNESHRRLSETKCVQICALGNIPLGAAIENGPDRESRIRESQ